MSDTLSFSYPSSFGAHQSLEQKQLRELLHHELMTLSFPAFAECVNQLLTSLGYSQVQPIKRNLNRREAKPRGVDFRLYVQAGVSKLPIVVQLKQYARPVHCRLVDELRGVALRAGAREGMLITTARFTSSARIAAMSNDTIPARLVAGDELLSLLFNHQIGVRRVAPSMVKADPEFFAELRRAFPASTEADKEPIPTSKPAEPPCESTEHQVPVYVFPPQRFLFQKGGAMMGRTHGMIGLNTLWLFHVLPSGISMEQLGWSMLAAVSGSLLPDLDAANSLIKSLKVGSLQPFVPLATLVHRSFGHRGVLHSLTGLVAVAVLAASLTVVWGWQPSLALWLGYASHLLADMTTKSGLPILLPFSKRRFYLLPARFRLTTGSMAEEVVFALFSMLAVLYLFNLLGQ